MCVRSCHGVRAHAVGAMHADLHPGAELLVVTVAAPTQAQGLSLGCCVQTEFVPGPVQHAGISAPRATSRARHRAQDGRFPVKGRGILLSNADVLQAVISPTQG